MVQISFCFVLLVGCVHPIKDSPGVLVVSSNEIRLVLNADKSKYMAMSQDQYAGRNHNILD